MADPQSPDTNIQQRTLEMIEQTNIAENLDEDALTKIGSECKKAFDEDLQSRGDWERDIEEWLKIAAQVRDEKSFPWQGASNVKYPLISTAAMQFSARAYPSLVPGD
jgi:chaperonin GroES